MDYINLCNAIRMEFEGVFENKIPLDAFPVKIQDMILALSRQENYSHTAFQRPFHYTCGQRYTHHRRRPHDGSQRRQS